MPGEECLSAVPGVYLGQSVLLELAAHVEGGVRREERLAGERTEGGVREVN